MAHVPMRLNRGSKLQKYGQNRPANRPEGSLNFHKNLMGGLLIETPKAEKSILVPYFCPYAYINGMPGKYLSQPDGGSYPAAQGPGRGSGLGSGQRRHQWLSYRGTAPSPIAKSR